MRNKRRDSAGLPTHTISIRNSLYINSHLYILFPQAWSFPVKHRAMEALLFVAQPISLVAGKKI